MTERAMAPALARGPGGAASRPRILFLAPRHPFPPWRGDQLRTYHFARQLARRAEVRVLCFAGDAAASGPIELRAVHPTIGGRLIANARHPDPFLPLQVRAFLDHRMEKALREELDEYRPDVLHATLSRMGPYLLSGPWHRHLDLVDSMQLNMATRAKQSRPPLRTAFALEARMVGRYESHLVAGVDSASVVGHADREAPGLETAAVVPNGVEPEQFPFANPGDRPPVVLFFGNLGYFHNVLPARFLAEKVIPRVRALSPDAILRIAGARPAASLRRLVQRPEVDLVPDPPEMAPVLHSAAVAALPMLSGSGMKNKILEAFSAGLPVVTNQQGIEGVAGAVSDEHYLLAEGETALADAVARLLRDPGERTRIATSARSLVVERYAWARQAETLMSLYGFPSESEASTANDR